MVGDLRGHSGLSPPIEKVYNERTSSDNRILGVSHLMIAVLNGANLNLRGERVKVDQR